MRKVKQINIKNRTQYFYNNQISLKDFGARLFKIDKKKLQRDWHLLHWLCDY